MLLTITTTRAPATDLGYLLHKHPERVQSFTLAAGRAHVFYPEASAERCTAALLLDIDPVGLVRGRSPESEGAFDHYVNDRPYAASSFLSVAIGRVYGSALGGHCAYRPELATEELPLVARVAALPCRGGAEIVHRLFGPLGYTVTAEPEPLDPAHPEWGQSVYHTVTLERTCTLHELLTHLYVLIPALDGDKHYWVGDDEVEKLLRHGAGWLATHPERTLIAARYLKRKRSLARRALARLAEQEPAGADQEAATEAGEADEATSDLTDAEGATGNSPDREARDGDEPVAGACAAPATPESAPGLGAQRTEAVVTALKASGARRVLDLGCGEGRLTRLLVADPAFAHVTAMDVSSRALEIAADRLRLERLPERRRERITLLHGSLTYRDRRLEGYDAAAVVEVIEHLDPARLGAFERSLFGAARPGTIVLTTPNREYNAVWETLPAGEVRHGDHRFEWTRAEFRAWAEGVATRNGYTVRYQPVGPEHDEYGPPTHMAIFTRTERGTDGTTAERSGDA